MTIQEFKIYYDKVSEIYPTVFANKHKEVAVWNFIRDLDVKWWKSISEKIIVSSNPRFDIEEAARGERIARQRILATKVLLAEKEKSISKISENGLSDYLKNVGARDLLEAIELKKSI